MMWMWRVPESYRIRYSAAALRDLEFRIPSRLKLAIILFIEDAISSNPRRVGKPLQRELEGFFVARRGDYRVIYRIIDELIEVFIQKIAHRAHAYRS